MNRGIELALVILGTVAPGVEGQSVDTVSSADVREAVQLLQGADTLPFLDPTEVEELARIISALRAAVPEIRGIRNYADNSDLLVYLSDLGESLADTVPPRSESIFQTITARRVGVTSLDSLNATLGVDSVTLRYLGSRVTEFKPHFPRFPNVPVLSDLYEELPEVSLAIPEMMVGGGDEVRLYRVRGIWYFVFIHAYGDCLAGCTEADYFFVRYLPEQRVFQLTDTIPPPR